MWNTVLVHEDDAAEEKENKAFNVIINSLDDYNIAYVCHLKLVSDLRSNNAVSLNLADNTQVKAKQSGEIKIPLEDGWLLLRSNVMFAPGFCKNLLALHVLLKEGYSVACWNAEKEILVNPTTDSQLYFGLRNGLFMLETSTLKPLPVEEANVIIARQPIPKLVQWHRRFAHLNFGALKQVIANGVIIGRSLSDSDLKETFDCEACMLAKARRMSYRNTAPCRAKQALEIVRMTRVSQLPRRRSVGVATTNCMLTKQLGSSGCT
ncbi:hypothetical protein B5M09_010980 [Aphanomyces astaci]|uniref:Uncharacterized protein n=1 Tax=Aphanomyces astaci TaxID=112090 RepID=A0A425D8C8_APHAT|nr:hypothetical protein B5M09_010980 [Aphanomyces astaci]